MSDIGSVEIKICGLTDPAAVHAAAEAGVERVGFVFASSPRQVTPQEAARLCEALPPTIARVAVLRRASQAAVDAICEHFVPDWLQADAQSLAGLTLPPEVKPMPVVRDGEPFDRRAWPALLYEAPVSGAGVLADWHAAARLARHCWLMLAGGLNPDNVAAAIAQVAPAAVDVSSGVESAPGEKDPARIRAFVAAARSAAATAHEQRSASAGKE